MVPEQLKVSKVLTGMGPLLAFTMLLTSTVALAEQPRIYNIPPATTYRDRYRTMNPEGPLTCAALLLSSTTPAPLTVERIIGFADKQFERRGWSSEFLAERIKLAEKFPKSEYFYTKQGDTVVGAIAATYAEYGGEQHHSERLPMEDSLHLTDLERPTDSAGRGLITEMRTYAIDGANPRDIRATLAFGALTSVLEKYRSYPELWNEPVIYTYGDEISLRLYGQMSFVNLSKQWQKAPVSHAGTQWWILGITPNKLKTLIDAEESRFGHFAKDGGETAQLPNGRAVKFLSHFTQKIENGKMTLQIVRSLAVETEIDEGLWAAPGSDLIFDTEGHLLTVTKISRPYRVPGTDLIAAADHKIEFYPRTGKPRVIEAVAQPFQILPDVWVRTGERVEWLPEGEYMRIGWDFYNPILRHAGSTGKPTRPLKPPKLVPSYFGVTEVEDGN